ncbi:MAG: flagellar hook-basal body complex protein FliE [Phycisphaerae bacterium]|jgi:flagellar hook-basal body complex protein FliE|nr:flagellar hook-basal body complex protein FliE [Phycisphaerae bacterium]|tara:strand:+ start:12467 stop:12778 length:312 start_codon:yes stop_codon:yes gene_type:complete
MPDPLGLIGDPNALQGAKGLPASTEVNKPGDPAFGNLLKQEIGKVNALQQDAQVAAEDFAAGRRDDIEGVLIAARKADTAFRMLLQVRNKVLDAYEEVKQLRV